MYAFKNRHRPSFLPLTCLSILFALLLTACGGDNDSDDDEVVVVDDTPSADSLTIQGTAVANTTDVNAVASLPETFQRWVAQLSLVTKAWADIDTGSDDNQALSNATVTLYKIFSDANVADEQVDIGTVTTDDTGAFSIPDLDLISDQDSLGEFYYEVRITKGALELRSPAAPSGTEGDVNVSPETDLAAKVLSDVLDVPTSDAPPLPSPALIESLREHVTADAGALVNQDAIKLPSALDTGFTTNSTATANGISAAGGDSEKLFKAASFSAEYKSLTTDVSSLDADASAYFDRIIRESCNQGNEDYLPQSLAQALGAYFNTDATLTATAIVTAYNDNFSGTDVDLASAVTAFQTRLTTVRGKSEASATLISPLNGDDQLLLYVLRDLDGSAFTATTEMSVDQAFIFVQTLAPTACMANMQLNLFGFVADLVEQSSLRSEAITASNIYHNSGFGCNEGSGEGHFYASIKVYKGAKNITSVVLSSDDSDGTVLGGDGQETLSLENSGFLETYVSNTNGVCVNLGKSVNYTVTVTFDDASTVTSTVARNHPRIPEASSEILIDDTFVAGASDSASPSVVDVTRPLYRWTSPATMLTNIIDDAANTAVTAQLASATLAVKYTYEFSHVDTTASPVSPASQCASVSSGKLYGVDSFLPTEDCDVAACATALSVPTSAIACRMNIQSYLVDGNDKILGQAAGHFRFFCVDTNDDDDCGA